MVWVKLSDTAHTHPKSTAAGLAEFGLWCAGLCYCNCHATDGRIPKTALRAVFPSDEVTLKTLRRAAERLVTIGRWHDEGESWSVHGYVDEQEEALRVNVDARRKRNRERQQALRDRNKNAELDRLSLRDTTSAVTRESHVTDHERHRTPSRPVPSRPVPYVREEKSGGTHRTRNRITDDPPARRARGSRASRKQEGETELPEDWKPSDELVAWAATARTVNLGRCEVKRIAAEFADWHRARGVTRKSWDAAFRNWLRKERRMHPDLPPTPERELPGYEPPPPIDEEARKLCLRTVDYAVELALGRTAPPPPDLAAHLAAGAASLAAKRAAGLAPPPPPPRIQAPTGAALQALIAKAQADLDAAKAIRGPNLERPRPAPPPPEGATPAPPGQGEPP